MIRSFLMLCFLMALTAAMIRCSWGAECKLAWEPQPDATSWRVYLGLDLLAEVTTPAATVQLPDAPCEVSVCAVNGSLQSKPATIKLSFIRDQQSADLRAWSDFRAYYREFVSGPRFYRTTIQTPP